MRTRSRCGGLCLRSGLEKRAAFPIHSTLAGIRCSRSALNGRSAGCRDRLILPAAAAADADGTDDLPVATQGFRRGNNLTQQIEVEPTHSSPSSATRAVRGFVTVTAIQTPWLCWNCCEQLNLAVIGPGATPGLYGCKPGHMVGNQPARSMPMVDLAASRWTRNHDRWTAFADGLTTRRQHSKKFGPADRPIGVVPAAGGGKRRTEDDGSGSPEMPASNSLK